MELANVDGAASLAVQDGPIAGSGATVSSATIPAIIIGYNLTDHLALETVLGVPFTVKFQATGTLANDSIAPTALGIPTGVGPLGPDLGEAKAAPPLITLVYKFLDPGARARPFVGVGAAILIAYDAKVTNPMLTAVSQPTMSVSPAPGMVFHGGIDVQLSKSWYARADVKYIAFMLANAEVDHIQVKTPDLPLFDHVEVGTAKMSVWVNPLIVQLGIGANF
jgi:outer membrane protein